MILGEDQFLESEKYKGLKEKIDYMFRATESLNL